MPLNKEELQAWRDKNLKTAEELEERLADLQERQLGERFLRYDKRRALRKKIGCTKAALNDHLRRLEQTDSQMLDGFCASAISKCFNRGDHSLKTHLKQVQRMEAPAGPRTKEALLSLALNREINKYAVKSQKTALFKEAVRLCGVDFLRAHYRKQREAKARYKSERSERLRTAAPAREFLLAEGERARSALNKVERLSAKIANTDAEICMHLSDLEDECLLDICFFKAMLSQLEEVEEYLRLKGVEFCLAEAPPEVISCLAKSD